MPDAHSTAEEWQLPGAAGGKPETRVRRISCKKIKKFIIMPYDYHKVTDK